MAFSGHSTQCDPPPTAGQPFHGHSQMILQPCLSCTSSASQPVLCRRHRGLPHRFPLVTMSGVSVTRGTSLITLHLLLPSRVQKTFQVFGRGSPFFFLSARAPWGLQPTNRPTSPLGVTQRSPTHRRAYLGCFGSERNAFC
jgi:hypothetical protein